jgi:hypothetical protein
MSSMAACFSSSVFTESCEEEVGGRSAVSRCSDASWVLASRSVVVMVDECSRWEIVSEDGDADRGRHNEIEIEAVLSAYQQP